METEERAKMLNKIGRVQIKLEKLMSKVCMTVLVFTCFYSLATRIGIHGIIKGVIWASVGGFVAGILFIIWFIMSVKDIKKEHDNIFANLINYVSILGYGKATFHTAEENLKPGIHGVKKEKE